MAQHLVFRDEDENVVALAFPTNSLDPNDWESVNATAVLLGNKVPEEDREFITEWGLYLAHEDDSEFQCAGWWNPRPRLTVVH